MCYGERNFGTFLNACFCFLIGSFLFILLCSMRQAQQEATYQDICVDVLSVDKTDTFFSSDYRVVLRYSDNVYYSRSMDDYYLCKDKVGQTIKAEIKTVEYSDAIVTNTIEKLYVD